MYLDRQLTWRKQNIYTKQKVLSLNSENSTGFCLKSSSFHLKVRSEYSCGYAKECIPSMPSLKKSTKTILNVNEDRLLNKEKKKITNYYNQTLYL